MEYIKNKVTDVIACINYIIFYVFNFTLKTIFIKVKFYNMPAERMRFV